ncbi:hypothetical protein CBM2600_A100076 [Cupriavidus taiwanensis]|nr:hypothetical protein CBM2600_A100076 [Cupriavidus taiwanensis]
MPYRRPVLRRTVRPSPQPSPASGRGGTHAVRFNAGRFVQEGSQEFTAPHAVRRLETPCR